MWKPQQIAITASKHSDFQPQKPTPEYEEPTLKVTVEDETDDREKANLSKKNGANRKPQVASSLAVWLLLAGLAIVAKMFLVLVGVSVGVGVYFVLGRKADLPS